MSTIEALRNNPQLASVRLAATTNQTGTYFNGQTGNGVGSTLTYATGVLTIDSVTVNLNDYVLLTAQTDAYQNGIYQCTVQGATGVSAVLQRRGDLQSREQIKPGYYVHVYAGTDNAGTVWTVVEPLPAAIGVPVVSGANDIIFQSTPEGEGGTVTFTAPSIAGNVAAWSNTTGNLENGGALGTAAGKAASSNGLSTLASTAGSGFTIGHVVTAGDELGSLVDSGLVATNLQLATNIKAGVSANVFQAGGPPFVSLPITVAGLTPASVVVAALVSQDSLTANQIEAIAVGTGSFTVTTQSAPVSSLIVSYTAFIAAQ